MSGKAIDVPAMQQASQHASDCVSIIKQWLPVEGRQTLATTLTMDGFHDQACRHCFEFFKYHPTPGQYSTVGPTGIATLWRTLCDSMVEVRNHYGWTEVDYENRLPHSDVRGGKELPLISQVILDRVSAAIESIGEMGIPSEFRTPPMNKKKASALFFPEVKNIQYRVRKLSKAMTEGAVRFIEVDRENFIFDQRQLGSD